MPAFAACKATLLICIDPDPAFTQIFAIFNMCERTRFQPKENCILLFGSLMESIKAHLIKGLWMICSGMCSALDLHTHSENLIEPEGQANAQ